MECFNDLLLKLREVHEREVEGWQGKVQELSNKKGCDTKRMEELFTRNQQMKEQQRLLTENIKTLENRLRAGLCDRCTVTQDVAKRRQQEFEATQIQSLQHISLLAGEINNLKKDNKRLRDEIRNLRAALEGPSNYSSSSSSSTSEVKPNSSPELSPSSSGPVALVTIPAAGRAANQPADGDAAVKREVDQRAEESERRQLRGTNRSHLESYKPLQLSPSLTLPIWKVEPNTRERRSQGVEDQRFSIPPHLKTSSSSSSSSSAGGDVKPSRHVLHAPVPCRPQPTKSSPVSLPWPLSESSEWVNMAAAGTNPLLHMSPKLNLPRFPNLIPSSQHQSPRRPGFGSPWQKQSASQPPSKEPTVVFKLRGLTDFAESQITSPEKKESPSSLKAESVSGEAYDGPLDLSDRGKSKSSQAAREDSPLDLQGGAKLQKSPDSDVNPPVSSPSPAVLPSSSCTVKQEPEPTSDHNHKVPEQNEEVNGKTDQSNGKKVPVLTISLRPVVVLETLNSALQKQESLSSNGKSSSPEDEPESNSDEQDEDEGSSGRESSRGVKRKRTSVETDTNRHADSTNKNQEGKIKITARHDEKSSG
ncbi:RBBP8 N-terminal-like protein isoform X2 [Stegastes partitus]|uniref:RBBP8 N-terminal-like protein isoform X2 n=1 Tax=Stegastes partitus TaxID=144197 RepID=A0A9Y4NCY0_9TELE|nr:PREDICTED: RBBP8 N-terminal-like protein isoform X2 [Stegastes partitus]